MTSLVADCPRCPAKNSTFDVSAAHHYATAYRWQKQYEVFAVCRNCQRASIFRVAPMHSGEEYNMTPSAKVPLEGTLNRHFEINGFVSTADLNTVPVPDHVPDSEAKAFNEGAKALAAQSWNAAGAMFRTCIDLATKKMLPEGPVEGLRYKQRRDLGLRLQWLFETGRLPEGMRELAKCIHQDGNDGVHDLTLKKADAEDLLDFTRILLERLYTEPERLRLAALRRDERRKSG